MMDAVRESRDRLLKAYSMLNNIVIGQEDMIKGVFIALVAREHAVIIGPPGTAKSFLVHSLAKVLNASVYSYLLTKFTDFSEIFGAIDIMSLANGQYKRNWSNIVNADIVFLDEIFKGSSSILNSLLSLMQERIVYDPMTGTPMSVKLWTLIGASNEVPSEEELQALYDRFSVRVFTGYLNDDISILKALESKWMQTVEIKPVAGMEDVKSMHSFAMQLLASKIKQIGEPLYKVYHLNAVSLVKSMRSKGILVSDRTIIEKLPKLYASYLTIYGVTAENIVNAIFDILPYLARDRSQLNDIKEVIEDGLGEVATLSRKLEEAKQKIRAGMLKDALALLEEIMNYDISEIRRKPWLKPRAEAVISLARDYHRRVSEQLKLLERLAEE